MIIIVLNERERAIILNQNKKDDGIATETHFTWKQVGSTVVDWKIYAFALVYLCGSIPVYSLSMFMPSIVRGMGYESLTAQVKIINILFVLRREKPLSNNGNWFQHLGNEQPTLCLW